MDPHPPARRDPDGENGSPSRRSRRRDWLELFIAYALILITIWTPRPLQFWVYWLALAWVVLSTWLSFPGWAAMGFRLGGFRQSLWVVITASALMAAAITVAGRLGTLHAPHGILAWIRAFGGYAIWAFAQQFLLQGYFLFRFLHLVSRRELAAIVAACIFSAAHLPNPILTPITLLWGICACFVFLRCRNFYGLAIAHAILGITVAITVPGPVVHNMRVGLGYLRYRAPHLRLMEPKAISGVRWPSH